MQEASERLADLSDDEPEIIARLILFMYNGKDSLGSSPKPATVALLAKLLGHPDKATLSTNLALQATLVAAADKYQMPDTLLEACKSTYYETGRDMWERGLSHRSILDFIASIKIIYRSPPAAGLRGRAIVMAQFSLAELQHTSEFLELLLATPEFATDLATKGTRQGFWCSLCETYVFLRENVMYCDDVSKLLEWIDYGEPQSWKDLACPTCNEIGTCTEVRPEKNRS